MNFLQHPNLINNRYQLNESLGSGGMGTVFQAVDRLTGQVVALKKLTQLTYDMEQEATLALSLAREFKTLAALRHPNIVAVLDYGFDEDHLPFFTMHILKDAQNLLEAGQGRSVEGRIELLLQLLQALAYLHRQGIIHGDLKPDNVLIVENQVQVLDFGLATNSQLSQTTTTGGTVAYMAPELFGPRAGYSPKSDLYAVGVMAFQLFGDRLPYDDSTMSVLVDNILTQEPDFDDLAMSDTLAQAIRRLMVKEPNGRFESANTTIAALSAAIQRPLPEETVEIRESYLQAAHFVGREGEMAILRKALDQLLAGKGDTWLVAGESGVGKSRLLDEFRTLALVEGVTVLHGQSKEEGGRAYELWRDVFRHLMLTPKLSDQDAAVLKPYLPDIERLLGREIPDAPALEPEMLQNRLFRVVVDSFKAQERPVLVILEDLHWTGSISLALLVRLLHITADVPLLLVGDYRDDERPNLPALLPEANSLKLERLNRSDIAELSAAILGKVGNDRQLIDRLHQETEGNPFFLVEVVRALAEEAGKLAGIQSRTLPEEIFASGVQQVVQRRLTQVPVEARPLLELAAIAGRELDLPLLTSLAENVLIDHWLNTCSQAAILEVQGERWRFTHNKLRAGVLAGVSEKNRTNLHHQVAIKREALYGDHPEQLSALLYHWSMANNKEKERHYAWLAGEQAKGQYANDEALRLFSRALALTPETEIEDRYKLLLGREEILDRQGNRPLQQADLTTLDEISAKLGIPEQCAVALRLAHYARAVSDYPQAISFGQRAVELGQAVEDSNMTAAGYLQWGKALRAMGEFSAARVEFGRSLELAQASAENSLIADSQRELGLVARGQSDYETAVQYIEEALHVFQQIGNREKEGACLTSLGSIAYDRGRYDASHGYIEQALVIFRQIGDLNGEADCLMNLGNMCGQQDDRAGARFYFEKCLPIFRQMGNRHSEATVLYNLGILYAYEGDYADARQCLELQLSLCRNLGLQRGEGSALLGLGFVFFNQGDYLSARTCLEQGLAIFRQIGDRSGESDCLNNLGVVASENGDYEQAYFCLQQALSLAREIEFLWQQGVSLNELGALALAVERPNEATAYYEQSFAIRQQLGQAQYLAEDRAGLARAAHYQDDGETVLAQIGEVLAYLEKNRHLKGAENPMRTLRFTWEVLSALGDERADEVLATASQLIQEQLDKIRDPASQEIYLARSHYAFMWQAWQAENVGSE